MSESATIRCAFPHLFALALLPSANCASEESKANSVRPVLPLHSLNSLPSSQQLRQNQSKDDLCLQYENACDGDPEAESYFLNCAISKCCEKETTINEILDCVGDETCNLFEETCASTQELFPNVVVTTDICEVAECCAVTTTFFERSECWDIAAGPDGNESAAESLPTSRPTKVRTRRPTRRPNNNINNNPTRRPTRKPSGNQSQPTNQIDSTPTANDENKIPCLTRAECNQQRRKLGFSKFLSSEKYNTKGCFSRGDTAYFGEGGTDTEKSTATLNGAKERIWCEKKIGTKPTSGSDESGATINSEVSEEALSTGNEGRKACLKESACDERRQQLGFVKYKTGETFQTKGCFYKKDTAFFGTGGTRAEKEEYPLSGEKERIWCDVGNEGMQNRTSLVHSASAQSDDSTSFVPEISAITERQHITNNTMDESETLPFITHATSAFGDQATINVPNLARKNGLAIESIVCLASFALQQMFM